ncbi:MAG: Ribbon-helix-helix domain, putative DNA-binding protein [Micavibrio sp.]|nr:Ribbon-helix-helix domain, putative DNA-binding protein [Micavibrio sp.]
MKKRSVRIADHPTSITLEDEFWVELKAIAESRDQSINQIITEIDEARGERNLSSAIRIFILKNHKP